MNADCIVSFMHINIALSRALIAQRDFIAGGKKLKTNSLSEEVLYYLSHSHTIKSSLETFGFNNINKAFMVMLINTNNEIKANIKQKLDNEFKENEEIHEHH